MNISALLLAVAITVFAVIAFFISRINSVRKAANDAIEKVNGRIDSYYDSNSESWLALAERVKKLEDSKICVLDSGTDEEGKTSVYAITKVGYSTVLVSLTENELAVIDSFIDWAELDEDFSAVKLDKHYTAENWRNKK